MRDAVQPKSQMVEMQARGTPGGGNWRMRSASVRVGYIGNRKSEGLPKNVENMVSQASLALTCSPKLKTVFQIL